MSLAEVKLPRSVVRVRGCRGGGEGRGDGGGRKKGKQGAHSLGQGKKKNLVAVVMWTTGKEGTDVSSRVKNLDVVIGFEKG
jgi:hypothetical protein